MSEVYGMSVKAPTVIIRDDDISYFTTPEELETLYGDLWAEGVKVSFAVIPYEVKTYSREDRRFFYQEDREYFIGENTRLVKYLRKLIKHDMACIMLHGYNHKYLIKNGRFIGEYAYQDYKTLYEKTKKGKNVLESLFNTTIKVFVPPNNDLSLAGVKAVTDNGLNICGASSIKTLKRYVNLSSPRHIYYLCLRLYYKVVYSRYYPFVADYPFIMDLGTHKELVSYAFGHTTNLNKLIKLFEFCLRKNAPFCIWTHYWDILINPRTMSKFLKFLKYVSLRGVEFSLINDVLK